MASQQQATDPKQQSTLASAQSAMNSQTIGCLNLNPQKHKLILDIARQLNFPHHFFKMPINELATYLKTKDFLVLIRTKMHVNFNQLNVESFRVSDGTIHIP